MMCAGKYPSTPPARQWELSGLDSITVFGMISHTANNGKTWTAVNTGLSNQFVRSFLSNGKTLLAGTKNGVFISSDNGVNWSPHNTGMAPGITIFSLLSINNNLFAGAASGVYRSGNAGASWTLQSNGFTGSPYVYALTSQGTDIFAGTQDNSVMRSSDNGDTWKPSGSGIPSGMTISSLQVLGSTSLMCGTDGAGCFSSNDGGNNWKLIRNGITHDRFFGLSSSKKAIYGGALNSVFRSTDNGISWTAITTNGLPAKVSINNIFVDGGKIFICTDTGILSYVDE